MLARSACSQRDMCLMRDQRRRYDCDEFAPKRGYYLSLPLNNRERHFELELVAPQTDFELCLTASARKTNPFHFA
jgi:hypothetical protein